MNKPAIKGIFDHHNRLANTALDRARRYRSRHTSNRRRFNRHIHRFCKWQLNIQRLADKIITDQLR